VIALVAVTVKAAPQESSGSPSTLKQVKKINPDGSYTFEFRTDDGSFRKETRESDGVVNGQYGYVDPTGNLKVVGYTSGKAGASADQVDQKALDYKYRSVDENEDGIPDSSPEDEQFTDTQGRNKAISVESDEDADVDESASQVNPN
jgi:Insect cuticle protein